MKRPANLNGISPKPLPSCPASFPTGSDLQRAFQVCKALESEEKWPIFCADNGRESVLPHLSPNRAAGVLGFSLLYPPSDAGRDNMAAEILGCNEDRELLAGLARLYAFGFIGFFYDPEEPPITLAEQSPAQSVEDITTSLEHLLEKPTLTAEELEDLVIVREGYFCPVTGRADVTLRHQEAMLDKLEVARVVGRPLSEVIQGGIWEHKFPTAGAIIERFGRLSACALLGSDSLNNPCNAMMLAPAAHWMFDSFNLWLTPFKENGKLVPDAYKLNFSLGYENDSYLNPVIFRAYTTPDGRTIEPPSPQLLAIHASCAQIAHMSAAVRHLEEIHLYLGPIRGMNVPLNATAHELNHTLVAQFQGPPWPKYA